MFAANGQSVLDMVWLTWVAEAVLFDDTLDVELVDKLFVGFVVTIDGELDFTEPLYNTAPDWEHDMSYETKSFKIRSLLNSQSVGSQYTHKQWSKSFSKFFFDKFVK